MAINAYFTISQGYPFYTNKYLAAYLLCMYFLIISNITGNLDKLSMHIGKPDF